MIRFALLLAPALFLSACKGGNQAGSQTTLAQEAARRGTETAVRAYLHSCRTAMEAARIERNRERFDFVPIGATCNDDFLGQARPQLPAEVIQSSIKVILPERAGFVLSATSSDQRTYQDDGTHFMEVK